MFIIFWYFKSKNQLKSLKFSSIYRYVFSIKPHVCLVRFPSSIFIYLFLIYFRSLFIYESIIFIYISQAYCFFLWSIFDLIEYISYRIFYLGSFTWNTLLLLFMNILTLTLILALLSSSSILSCIVYNPLKSARGIHSQRNTLNVNDVNLWKSIIKYLFKWYLWLPTYWHDFATCDSDMWRPFQNGNPNEASRLAISLQSVR